MADLVKRGFTVAVPWGDNARYDLLVDDGNGIRRVQVKYIKSYSGGIHVRFRSAGSGHYTWDEVDRIAIYDPESGGCYYLSEADMNGRIAMVLRVKPAVNKQVSGIVWADQYREW